jgi:hypothetical protein
MTLLLKKLNRSAARIAPNLPAAAETPNADPRTREGYTSPEKMNVVEFAPKLKKNLKLS